MKVLKNALLNGELTDITVDDGKIIAIGKTDAEGLELEGCKVYPGLIDIHIHGCIGYDTMEGGLEEMSDWLLANGTTAWYPTTMSMSEEDIINATSQNIDFNHGATVLGFHMEGPFINKKYKGSMNEKYIKP